MAFRVEVSDQAERDADSILEWLLSQHAGQAGTDWFLALDDAFASLAEFPERCPIAPENTRFPFEVRQLLYGRKPHVYSCRTNRSAFSTSASRDGGIRPAGPSVDWNLVGSSERI